MWFKGIFTFLAVMATVGCMAIITEDRDWNFIESVGGLRIDEPLYTNGKWYLPVECDVSGMSTITVKPKIMNSGIIMRDVKAELDRNSVFIWVRTYIPNDVKNITSNNAELGNPQPGKYAVFYGKAPRWYRFSTQKRVKIGDIEIKQ